MFFLAAFSAAWAASRVAAVMFAVYFGIGIGMSGPPNAPQIGLLELLVSSLFWLCVVAILGSIITFPAAILAGGIARLLIWASGLNSLSIHALAGFLVGTGIWYLLFRDAHPGAFLLGSSSAAWVIGGSAGTIGGLVFETRMRRRTTN